MQAIITKYAGPTNSRGSRIIAATEGGTRVSVPYRSELDTYENHERAAHALMHKLGWKGRVIGGSVKHGYAFVFTTGSGRDVSRSPRRVRTTRRR